MLTLALPGVDTMPPARERRGALSQWFTPAPIARKMAYWSTPLGGRVLEPSAGGGALVRAWKSRLAEHDEGLEYSDVGPAQIDAVEIDPEFAAAEGFECCDYLTRATPAERYALGLSNPPYEGGLDGAFVEKMMRECDRMIVLLRLAALAGQDRHERVWRAVEEHRDGWWMPGLAIFSSRPVFDGPESASGSAKSDFCCVKLSRVSPPSATQVEWW